MIYSCNASKIQIYLNTGRKNMSQIKAQLGCDVIINGGLYNMSNFKPVCHLKVDGVVHAQESWNTYGLGWDTTDIHCLSSADMSQVQNFISCVEIIHDGVAVKLSYDRALGGARGRTALGVDKSGNVAVFVSKGGTSLAMTPEKLQSYLLSQGWVSALMLDGGGSSQGITPAGTITSSRNVQNYICVYLKKSTATTPTTTKPVCPYAEPAAIIRYGSRGVGAKWVQWHLNQIGYTLVVDGIFGPASRSALLKFQKAAKLTQDALCGNQTRAALKAAVK